MTNSALADPIRAHFNTAKGCDRPHVFGSTLCRAEHFILPLFAYWCEKLKLHPAMHRKLWEFVFITQTLHELERLRPGIRGLGFGVGREPLPAFFASSGVEVIATDLAYEQAQASGWSKSGQYASALEKLFWPGIVDQEVFDRQVRFRPLDMNQIPTDICDLDFCWSACAMEHLGSIEAGIDFLEGSLSMLKSGGVAVHTTEYNLSSDEETLSEGGTVLFRKQDIRLIARLLARKGHRLLPLTLYAGATAVDRYVDVPPYTSDVHLRLRAQKYDVTSIGLAVIKA